MTTLSEVFSSLGVNRGKEQIALLENMMLDGLLDQREVWGSIHRIDRLSRIKPYGAAMAYDTLARALQEANAHDFNRFNAAQLLAADLSDGLSHEDLQDWVTYSRQTAFGRSGNTDYSHLPKDARPEELQARYYENARIMGRVGEVKAPEGVAAYDESWLQCASRARIESRLESLLEVMRTGTEIGDVRIATGNGREATLPFDGIAPKQDGTVIRTAMQEGKEYLTGLAHRLGREIGEPAFVPVNPMKPDGALKANVQPPLTEADIAWDVTSAKLPERKIVQVSQTTETGYANRTDTRQSTKPLIPALVDKIKSGAFADRQPGEDGRISVRLLNITDQPFIPRMHLQVERLIHEALRDVGLDERYRVDIDTIGKGCEIGFLNFIRSDSAAWAQQQHETMQLGAERRRPLEGLQFNNHALRRGWEPPQFPSHADVAARRVANGWGAVR